MRQQVVCLVPDGASVFELATPIGVFGPDRATANELPIEFTMCGFGATTATVEGGLRIGGLMPLEEAVVGAHTIIVPTWPIGVRPVPPELADALAAAHASGSRLVGLCLGAFAIAATGLLDGRSATTHWRHRRRFEAENPEVVFEANSLYVDLDTVVTSAGSAAAVDCCIHLLRLDHGAEVAARVAKSMVTAPHRGGTQSQFASTPTIEHDGEPIGRALSAASERIAEIGGVSDLAEVAQTSRRSLERHMRDLLGVTPAAWISEQRVALACRLLETTDMSVEATAAAAGYGSVPSLRRAFREQRDTTPTAYRAAFQLDRPR